MASIESELFVRDMGFLKDMLLPHVWADVMNQEGTSVVAHLVSDGFRFGFRLNDSTLSRVRKIIQRHAFPDGIPIEDDRPWERPADWWKQA